MVLAGERREGAEGEGGADTRLEYLDDMQRTEGEAKVVNVVLEDGRIAVILNQTIFYPQGGGQPADHGWILSVDRAMQFRVEDVRQKGGLVYHYGFFSEEQEAELSAEFRTNQEVILEVDFERRYFHSRLHSAGHLLDSCVLKFCKTELLPERGYHFPDSPNVEYKGVVPKDQVEDLRTEAEVEANRLVTAGGEIYSLVTDYSEAEALCGGYLPDFIPKESRPRIVVMAGLGCPCGGTHVRDISEIGPMKVRKIRAKKGMTIVSYTIEKEVGTIS